MFIQEVTFLDNRDKRHTAMTETVRLFRERGLKNVVELGSIRLLDSKESDGHSTLT